MKIQLIRNATMKINYAGKTILTDPMLSPKGTFQPFADIERNPTIELPVDLNEIVKEIDAVLVTHTHPDHFDQSASDALNKNIPLFFQPGDEERMKNDGFTNAVAVQSVIQWEGITITRTGGRHGSGKILEYMGKVSGFVLQAQGEPTVYWAGDTILCDEVREAFLKYEPDIIITHSGGAVKPGFDMIIMDAAQTLEVMKLCPKSKVVAIHMETLDHCPLTRESLRSFAEDSGIDKNRLMIPKDGETVVV